MLSTLLLLGAGLGAAPGGVSVTPPTPVSWVAAAALHTYEARIRLAGKVSTTRVQASDAGQAKRLVQAQYGDKVTVLSVKRIDAAR